MKKHRTGAVLSSVIAMIVQSATFNDRQLQSMQLLSVLRSCSRRFMRAFKTLLKFFEILAQLVLDRVRWSGNPASRSRI